MRRMLVLVVSLLLIPSFSFAAGRIGKRVKPTKVTVIKSLKMNPERTVVLRGDIDDVSVPPVISQMVDMEEESKDEIFLILNSPGGSVTDGVALITAILSIKSPVICVIDTEAYSMAAIIASYCRKVYIHKNASLMFHEASFGIKGSESIVKSRMEFITNYLESIHKQTAEVLNMPLEEYKAKLIKEWWLDSKQAVLSGVADVVLEELVYKYDPPEAGGLFVVPKEFVPERLKDVDIRM